MPFGEVTSEALSFLMGREREVKIFLKKFGRLNQVRFRMTSAALLRRIQKDL